LCNEASCRILIIHDVLNRQDACKSALSREVIGDIERVVCNVHDLACGKIGQRFGFQKFNDLFNEIAEFVNGLLWSHPADPLHDAHVNGRNVLGGCTGDTGDFIAFRYDHDTNRVQFRQIETRLDRKGCLERDAEPRMPVQFSGNRFGNSGNGAHCDRLLGGRLEAGGRGIFSLPTLCEMMYVSENVLERNPPASCLQPLRVNSSPDAVRITPTPATGGTEFENFMCGLVRNDPVADFRDELKVGGVDEKVDGVRRDANAVIVFHVELRASERGIDRIADFIAVIIDPRRNVPLLFFREPIETVLQHVHGGLRL